MIARSYGVNPTTGGPAMSTPYGYNGGYQPVPANVGRTTCIAVRASMHVQDAHVVTVLVHW